MSGDGIRDKSCRLMVYYAKLQTNITYKRKRADENFTPHTNNTHCNKWPDSPKHYH